MASCHHLPQAFYSFALRDLVVPDALRTVGSDDRTLETVSIEIGALTKQANDNGKGWDEIVHVAGTTEAHWREFSQTTFVEFYTAFPPREFHGLISQSISHCGGSLDSEVLLCVSWDLGDMPKIPQPSIDYCSLRVTWNIWCLQSLILVWLAATLCLVVGNSKTRGNETGSSWRRWWSPGRYDRWTWEFDMMIISIILLTSHFFLLVCTFLSFFLPFFISLVFVESQVRETTFSNFIPTIHQDYKLVLQLSL